MIVGFQWTVTNKLRGFVKFRFDTDIICEESWVSICVFVYEQKSFSHGWEREREVIKKIIQHRRKQHDNFLVFEPNTKFASGYRISRSKSSSDKTLGKLMRDFVFKNDEIAKFLSRTRTVEDAQRVMLCFNKYNNYENAIPTGSLTDSWHGCWFGTAIRMSSSAWDLSLKAEK